MDQYQITKHGNWEYAISGITTYKRRKGTEEWTLVYQAPVEAQVTLSLILQRQPFGGPDHWSLFVAPEGGTGQVYQVKGDAEFMQHTHVDGVNILASNSFKTAYTLSTLSDDQAGRVAYYANSEIPPSAPDQASVTENCQAWTVRVLERLAQEGIVTEEWVAHAKDMVEPLL